MCQHCPSEFTPSRLHLGVERNNFAIETAWIQGTFGRTINKTHSVSLLRPQEPQCARRQSRSYEEKRKWCLFCMPDSDIMTV